MSQAKSKTPEFFPERRSIVRRPANGLCHFCLKFISASNWSRHIRSQHLKELVKMKHGDQSPTLSEELFTSAEQSQYDCSSAAECTMMMLFEERHIPMADDQCHSEPAAGISGDDDRSAKRKNDGRRKRRDSAQNQQQTTEPTAVPKRPRRTRRMCCAIRLPENNVCPLCGKGTSAGNWSRHLKRHHPEYALTESGEEQQVGSTERDEAGLTTEQQQQEMNQRKTEESKEDGHMDQRAAASALQHETDFSLVHLQQFLVQQKQHNNFDTFGLGESVAKPTIDEQPLNNCHPLSAVKALGLKLEESNFGQEIPSTTEGSAELINRMICDRTMDESRGMSSGDGTEARQRHLVMGEERQQRQRTMAAPTGNGDEQQHGLDRPSTSGSSAMAKEPPAAAETANNRQKAQRRTSAIRPDKDGRCPLCGKSISSPNWRRHLLRCHPEEELLAQYKYPDPVFSVPVPTRLFALYAATAHMPLDHLDNEFLRKFLSFVPEFDIPSRRMLQAQMDGEVERVKQRIRSALSSQKLLAASVHIEGGMVEGQMLQQNTMAICAHFWDTSAQSAECVGLSLGPVGYSNDDIADAVRERLAEMELTMERGKFIRFTVDKSSSFSSYNARPSFFNPFPFIGGGSFASAMALPFDWQLVDCSPEVLEAFFNNDAEEDDAGGEEAEIGLGEGIEVTVCAARRLETVLRTVLERDQQMVQLRKRLFLLFGQFAFSHSACTALSARNGGVSLLFPANVRWHSLEPAYARLFNLCDTIGAVCDEFKIERICERDWRTVETALEISDTFHKFVAKLEQHGQPTISLLFPGLNLLLSTFQQNFSAQMPSLIDAFSDQIRRSFSDVLSFDRNSLFLCASMLDPKVAYLLVQEQKQEGVRAIRKMVEHKISDPSTLLRVRSNIERFLDVVESPFGFGTIRRVRAPIIGTAKEQNAMGEERDQIDIEIMEYLDIVQLDSSESCAQFWTKHGQRFPLLSETAKSVLAVPATAATAKRLLRQIWDGVERDAEVGVRKALLRFNRRFVDLAE
ncbi:hypothetical protein niasHT_010766 [Heterodera trifolii]|uniref:C2H2-type domain-containing protein n=1 Tax=Heterodera trifolii TaxID=157864 RepID=A0ABD2KVB6_9BILA